VIARATLALRPVRRRVRTFHLLYGDLAAWMADQKTLVASGRAQYIEGFLWSSAKGTRSDARGVRRPFSHWMYGLQVGFEYDEAAPEAGAALAGLAPFQVTEVQDDDLADHLHRYQPRFDGMRQSGAWQQTHPWLECLVPASRLPDLLPAVLEALPLSLGDGHRAVWVAREGAPPFFALPEGEPAVCLGILPTGVSPAEREPVLQAFRQIDRQLRAAGGKRYLSGWLGPMSDEDWRCHFGARHADWLAVKRRYDPQGLFRSVLLPGA
jgi:cytokinin dehydrogenase